MHNTFTFFLACSFPAEKCTNENCSVGSIYTPKLRGKFLATENFFYTSKVCFSSLITIGLCSPSLSSLCLSIFLECFLFNVYTLYFFTSFPLFSSWWNVQACGLIIHVLHWHFCFFSLVLRSWTKRFSFRSDGGWTGVLWWGLVEVEKEIQATWWRWFAALLLLISVYCGPTSWQSWNWIRGSEVPFSSHASYMQVHILRMQLVGVSYRLRTSLWLASLLQLKYKTFHSIGRWELSSCKAQLQ